MEQRLESFVACAVQLFIWIPLRILFFGFGRLKVSGWNNIAQLKAKPFIIASNHVSFLDPFLVSHIFPFSTRFFPFRYPAFPAHYYTWKRPFMWMLGSYPIFKGDALEEVLDKSLAILKHGDNILIFPESKIKRKGRTRSPRRGVAYLAAKAHLPILPCFISGFYPERHAIGFTWKDLFLRKYHIKVTLGEPFFVQDVYKKIPETLDEYKNAAHHIMQKVYELKDS